MQLFQSGRQFYMKRSIMEKKRLQYLNTAEMLMRSLLLIKK